MATKTAIIIGAGIIGMSTAYQLARRRYGKILVFEKGLVGDGSSSRGAAIVTAHMWSEEGVNARKKSMALFRELSQELPGYTFHPSGCLNLFDPATWPERERLLPLYDRCQAPYEILSPAELKRRWPDLEPAEGDIGLFDPLGGWSEPHEYIPALARKSRELGVAILEHQTVREIVVRSGQVTAVRTDIGEFQADAVVATVYSWSQPLFAGLGLRLPYKTFPHQRYVTSPLSRPLDIPGINANSLRGYIRPAFGNRVLIGGSVPDQEEFRVPSIDWHMSSLRGPNGLKEELMTRFRSFVPALAKADWEMEKVGLLTNALGGDPILGPLDRFPGLFVCFALHSGGWGYNPVAGFLMAEYVAEGKTSIDVRTFSPNRFNAKQSEAFLASRLKQKDLSMVRH